MPALGAGRIYLGSNLISGGSYARPADWVTMPTVTAGDQKACALAAVWDNGTNFVALKCQGAYVVDWGDGSAPENVATNVQVNHNFSYAGVSSGTLTSRGYRQAMVTITPQAGQNLTKLDFSVKHTQAGLTNSYEAPWLEIVMAGSLVTTLLLAGSASTFARPAMLERFEYVGTSGVTTCSNLFYHARSLQEVVGTAWTAAVTNFAGMFSGCNTIQSIPALDTHLGTGFGGMFQSCFSLQSVPLLDTHLGTSFNSMFSNCSSLQSVPLFDTANGVGTAFSTMFNGCTSLRSVPLFNTSQGTSFSSMFFTCESLQTLPLLDTHLGTNFNSMFDGCTSLRTVPALNLTAATSVTSMFNQCYQLQRSQVVNTKISIDYTGCSLSPAALNEVYTNLFNPVTAKTATVSNNWGTTADTPSIATAKGWTVTGT